MGAEIRDVLLPQLGMGMSEGEIVEWLAIEGARVERDQPLVSIENEKTVTELPAPFAGFVHFVVDVGRKIPIETVIAKIATSEDAYRGLVNGGQGAESDVGSPSVVVDANGGASVAAKEPPSARIRASGVAKALARSNGVNLAAITGTGPYGRIVKRDVLEHLKGSGPAALPDAIPSNVAAAGVLARDVGAEGRRAPKARLPLTGARGAIARRMVQASVEAAQTFVFFEVDVTDLLRVRKLLDQKVEDEGKLTALAYYAKAVALACKRVPIANATVEDGEIFLWNEVNIGIAVALPGATEHDSSLVVPVVHGVESLGIAALSRKIREKVQKARDRALTPADVANGTITISSNAGLFPGMWVYSTPLLNLPQAIIFQPGNAAKRPVVVDDEIVIRTILPCSLTFDHRCLDGEPTARFIRELSGFLTNPETMML